MNEDIKAIAEIRKRQRAAIVQLAKDNPGNPAVANLLAIDRELCDALSDAIKTHGPKLGVDGPVTAASTAPKDD